MIAMVDSDLKSSLLSLNSCKRKTCLVTGVLLDQLRIQFSLGRWGKKCWHEIVAGVYFVSCDVPLWLIIMVRAARDAITLKVKSICSCLDNVLV